MKTFTRFSVFFLALVMAGGLLTAQQQIAFEGLVNQGLGTATWNANGSGPEPAATGHLIPFPGFGYIYYYGASMDYVTGNSDHACFAFLPEISGFPAFTQALSNYGYTPDQVKAKFGLVTLGEDEEGLDWFVMGDYHHSSHTHSNFNILELGGEPLLASKIEYSVWSIKSTSSSWIIDFGYSPMINISGGSSAGVQAAAQAFLDDLDGKSIRLQCESNFGGSFAGNGRNGSYYNIINGTLSVGYPTIPLKGLFADNQGAAAWNADGTGPEPFGNGHQIFLYYGASVDYQGINTNPDACLAHFLEGSSGFYHTLLQLQYRGFEMGDMKIKMGLSSLGPDIEDEDWGNINGVHWLNQYNSHFIIELNGEPILSLLQDTNRMVFYDPGSLKWSTETSIGKVYNISDNASADAKYVALSFLRDFGSHYLKNEVAELSYAGSFSGNGRSGAWYEIIAGQLIGVYEQATFVPPGEVSGTWTAENSPYYVDGHLEIANGETLTIEPGVKVAVRGPYHFDVQGCVKAEGTAEKPIIFTRSNPNLWWDGFDYFETPSTNQPSIFEHCLFEYGYGLGTAIGLNSGGMFAIKQFDSIMISNSIFRHNKVDIDGFYPPSGGAIGLWDADISVSKCVFYANKADYGGALFSYALSNPIVSNCLFYENTAPRGGAITFYDHGHGTLINNTIVDNQGSYGGALYFYRLSNPEIINTILWGNEATISGNQVYSASLTSGPGFYYSNIEGGQAGFGGSTINGGYLFNLDDDPDFETNPDYPPYSLRTTSPCIDMGTPDTSAWYYPQYLPATCLCGNPRVSGSCIDIGAYEYVITGISEKPAEAHALLLFPNPVQYETTIRFSIQNAELVTIELYNSIGEIVESIFEGNLQAGEQNIAYQTTRLKPGIYFCIINYGDQVLTQKLIKH